MSKNTARLYLLAVGLLSVTLLLGAVASAVCVGVLTGLGARLAMGARPSYLVGALATFSIYWACMAGRRMAVSSPPFPTLGRG